MGGEMFSVTNYPSLSSRVSTENLASMFSFEKIRELKTKYKNTPDILSFVTKIEEHKIRGASINTRNVRF